MRISHFFIDRPIFACVVSIVFVILGAVVLAPAQVSQTLLIQSADLTTVAPRPFYAWALADVPEAHARERLLLQKAIEPEAGEDLAAWPEKEPTASEIADALALVGVDLACVPDGRRGVIEAVEAAGYARLPAVDGLTCLRAPDATAR